MPNSKSKELMMIEKQKVEKQKVELITRMNKLKSLIPDTIKAVNLLPDDMYGDMYTFLEPGVLRVTIQYSPGEYLNLRRKLAALWKYEEHSFNDRTGNIYVYFQHRFLEVVLTLELEMPTEYQDGIACKLVEIGHETEVIYGLECK